jgi:hypothetical protein
MKFSAEKIGKRAKCPKCETVVLIQVEEKEAKERREWARLLPPVVVAVEGASVEVCVHIPVMSLGEIANIAVRREDGSGEQFEIALRPLTHAGSAEFDGAAWVRVQVPLPVELPPMLSPRCAASIGQRRCWSRWLPRPGIYRLRALLMPPRIYPAAIYRNSAHA